MTEEQLTITSNYWWNKMLSQTQKEKLIKDYYNNDETKLYEVSEEGIKRIYMSVHKLLVK